MDLMVASAGRSTGQDIEGWHLADAPAIAKDIQSLLPDKPIILLAPTTLLRFDCTGPSSLRDTPCRILERYKHTLFPMDAIIVPAVKSVILYLDRAALAEIRACRRHTERKIWTAKDYFEFRGGWDMALAYAGVKHGVIIHPTP